MTRQLSQEETKRRHFLVEEWRLSGQNAKAWCYQKKIPYRKFIHWREYLKHPKKPPHPFDPSLLIELKDNDDTGISLAVREVTIHLQKGFDQETLTRCLRVLRC